MLHFKQIKILLSLLFLVGFHLTAFADVYEWYWGKDVLPRDYSEYCQEPGINAQCQKTCASNGYTFPNSGIGEGNGQAYCKQLVTHYKLWCSCDTGQLKYPQCVTGVAVLAGSIGCPGACTVKCNLLCAPEGGYCSGGPETVCYSGSSPDERCDCGNVTCNTQDGPDSD